MVGLQSQISRFVELAAGPKGTLSVVSVGSGLTAQAGDASSPTLSQIVGDIDAGRTIDRRVTIPGRGALQYRQWTVPEGVSADFGVGASNVRDFDYTSVFYRRGSSSNGVSLFSIEHAAVYHRDRFPGGVSKMVSGVVNGDALNYKAFLTFPPSYVRVLLNQLGGTQNAGSSLVTGLTGALELTAVGPAVQEDGVTVYKFAMEVGALNLYVYSNGTMTFEYQSKNPPQKFSQDANVLYSIENAML